MRIKLALSSVNNRQPLIGADYYSNYPVKRIYLQISPKELLPPFV